MKNGEKPIVNPYVMLREEFDDWAVLFNPDTSHGFGLSPTGVCLWKLLDGEHTMDDLLENIRHHAANVPEDAGGHIRAFVDALVAEGLAGFGDGDKGPCREKCSPIPPGAVSEVAPFTYEPPKLVNLSSGQTAQGSCGNGSHTGGGSCGNGTAACGCSTGSSNPYTYCCGYGGCATIHSCCGGSCDSAYCSYGLQVGVSCCGGSCDDACGCGGCVGSCNSGDSGGGWGQGCYMGCGP